MCIRDRDNIAFGGNGFANDSVVHFTIADPLYKKEKKEWLKLYIPARTAVAVSYTHLSVKRSFKELLLF